MSVLLYFLAQKVTSSSPDGALITVLSLNILSADASKSVTAREIRRPMRATERLTGQGDLVLVGPGSLQGLAHIGQSFRTLSQRGVHERCGHLAAQLHLSRYHSLFTHSFSELLPLGSS